MKVDELRIRLCLAIDRLDPTPRLVVALFHYEELSVSEIAEVIDLNEATVQIILDKATARLKREFKVTLKEDKS